MRGCCRAVSVYSHGFVSGLYASLNAVGGLWPLRAKYRVVPGRRSPTPRCRVGLSEQEAQQRNIGYELTRYESIITTGHWLTVKRTGSSVLTVPGADRILV